MKLPFKYNAKSLFVRRGNTLMTVASIALVVPVFVGVLAMASGLSMSLRASGEALNVLVLRDGARSETESSFDKARQRLVGSLPGVAAGADGAPLVSAELVTLQIFARAAGKESNVSLRGVGPRGPAMPRAADRARRLGRRRGRRPSCASGSSSRSPGASAPASTLPPSLLSSAAA